MSPSALVRSVTRSYSALIALGPADHRARQHGATAARARTIAPEARNFPLPAAIRRATARARVTRHSRIAPANLETFIRTRRSGPFSAASPWK